MSIFRRSIQILRLLDFSGLLMICRSLIRHDASARLLADNGQSGHNLGSFIFTPENGCEGRIWTGDHQVSQRNYSEMYAHSSPRHWSQLPCSRCGASRSSFDYEPGTPPGWATSHTPKMISISAYQVCLAFFFDSINVCNMLAGFFIHTGQSVSSCLRNARISLLWFAAFLHPNSPRYTFSLCPLGLTSLMRTSNVKTAPQKKEVRFFCLFRSPATSTQ